MKLNIKSALFALATSAMLIGCNDDVPTTGSDLVQGEVTIYVDSLTMKLNSASVYEETFDSRAVTKLLGKLRVEQYGNLDCSFVTQLMAATSMEVPDSITVESVDSMRLIFTVPRGQFTGDSLAPQQLTVYRLIDQLPADINSSYDPTGHYNTTPLGSRTYTVSALSQAGDSLLPQTKNIRIPVMMPKDLAIETFKQYRENPSVFQWPASFNKYFPGIYVEQSFGNGCVANITKVQAFTYWHRPEMRYIKVDGEYGYHPVIVRDSVCLFASVPEVLSSNNIRYTVSEKIRNDVGNGAKIITTPGGYHVDFTFPYEEIFDIYHKQNSELSVISTLSLSIPAQAIENNRNIGAAPYLLMVLKKDLDQFFSKNKLPDQLTSFSASYNKEKKRYMFPALRTYLLNLLEKKEIKPEDIEFTLIPVEITTEDVSDYYGNTTPTVVGCTPYTIAPTMTRLDMDRAVVTFAFSQQSTF